MCIRSFQLLFWFERWMKSWCWKSGCSSVNRLFQYSTTIRLISSGSMTQFPSAPCSISIRLRFLLIIVDRWKNFVLRSSSLIVSNRDFWNQSTSSSCSTSSSSRLNLPSSLISPLSHRIESWRCTPTIRAQSSFFFLICYGIPLYSIFAILKQTLLEMVQWERLEPSAHSQIHQSPGGSTKPLRIERVLLSSGPVQSHSS